MVRYIAVKSTWVKILALSIISQVAFRLLLCPSLCFFLIIKYKIGV